MKIHSGCAARISARAGVCLAVAILPSCDSTRRPAPRGYPWLELEEVRVTPIDSEPLGGAAVIEAGGVVFWTRSAVATVRAGESLIRRLCPAQLSRVVAAAFTLGDSVVEVVDGGSNSILRTRGTQTCIRRRVLGTGDVIAGAARSGNAWILLVTSKRAPAKLQRVSFEEPPVTMVAFDSLFDASYQVSRSTLSVARNQTILSNENWPFSWMRIDTTGKRKSFVSGALSVRPQEDDDSLRPWIALPIVALDKGFLQILVQPASDHRLLLLYDDFARFVRASQPPASFGVLAASDRASLLVASRRRAKQELVLYRWKWVP